MDLGLKGRAAIVAAASGGLGRATALELAREGANVAIGARGESELLRTADEIRDASGAEVLPVAGDLTDEAYVRRFVAEARSQFGRVDILVANAGGPPA